MRGRPSSPCAVPTLVLSDCCTTQQMGDRVHLVQLERLSKHHPRVAPRRRRGSPQDGGWRTWRSLFGRRCPAPNLTRSRGNAPISCGIVAPKEGLNKDLAQG